MCVVGYCHDDKANVVVVVVVCVHSLSALPNARASKTSETYRLDDDKGYILTTTTIIALANGIKTMHHLDVLPDDDLSVRVRVFHAGHSTIFKDPEPRFLIRG